MSESKYLPVVYKCGCKVDKCTGCWQLCMKHERLLLLNLAR
jgi:hypothetical protein